MGEETDKMIRELSTSLEIIAGMNYLVGRAIFEEDVYRGVRSIATALQIYEFMENSHMIKRSNETISSNPIYDNYEKQKAIEDGRRNGLRFIEKFSEEIELAEEK